MNLEWQRNPKLWSAVLRLMQNKYTDNEELVQSLFLVCPYCDFDEEEALEPPTYSSWKSLMLHFEKCRSCGEQWANDPYFDLVEATTQVCPFGFGKGGILTTSKDGYCKNSVWLYVTWTKETC